MNLYNSITQEGRYKTLYTGMAEILLRLLIVVNFRRRALRGRSPVCTGLTLQC